MACGSQSRRSRRILHAGSGTCAAVVEPKKQRARRRFSREPIRGLDGLQLAGIHRQVRGPSSRPLTARNEYPANAGARQVRISTRESMAFCPLAEMPAEVQRGEVAARHRELGRH